jgi:hypothetical protein
MEELTETTGTTDTARRTGPVETPGAVTVGEAVKGWHLSNRTLRRRLAAGEVAGAYKVPGGKGEEWRIPADALDALGYERQTNRPAVPETPPPPPEPTPAERLAGQLADLLDRETKALESARDMYAEARADAARLEAELAASKRDADRERERADQLAAELVEARKPRRRWGRK